MPKSEMLGYCIEIQQEVCSYCGRVMGEYGKKRTTPELFQRKIQKDLAHKRRCVPNGKEIVRNSSEVMRLESVFHCYRIISKQKLIFILASLQKIETFMVTDLFIIIFFCFSCRMKYIQIFLFLHTQHTHTQTLPQRTYFEK